MVDAECFLAFDPKFPYCFALLVAHRPTIRVSRVTDRLKTRAAYTLFSRTYERHEKLKSIYVAIDG